MWPVETEGNTLLEVTLGKIGQQSLTNLLGKKCLIRKVFRRFLAIHSVDFSGRAKIN